MLSPRRSRSKTLSGPLLSLSLLLAGAAQADIVPLPNSLTLVSPGGGTKVVSGGVARGQNLFHRFAEFDTTTGGISAVRVDNAVSNVIVGVVNKSVIDKSVMLANRGNLYFLSPNGISIRPGASFGNIDTLLLTTSSKLALGANVFDVYATGNAVTLADDANGYTASPSPTVSGLLTDNLKEGGGAAGAEFFGYRDGNNQWQAESFERPTSFGIEIAPGSNLTVDRSLLLVTHKSPITIQSASLNARGAQPGNPNAYALDRFGEGDGLAIVTQNLNISGSASIRSAFTSNSEILIREPLPVFNSVLGSLESVLYSFDNIGSVQYSGTVSRLKISGLDLISGDSVPATSTWKVLLRAYGLACQFGDCGANKPIVTVQENGVDINLARVGRLSVADDFNFQGQFKANQALYAGIDLTDARIISGYSYAGSGQAGFQIAAPARLEFGFDPGFQKGGGRLENLQFYIADAANLVRLDLGYSVQGAYNGKLDFPSSGPASRSFLNNKPYAATLGPNQSPDLAMYWFFDGDAGGNNSISFASVLPLPMAAGGGGNNGAAGGGNAGIAGGGNNGATVGNSKSGGSTPGARGSAADATGGNQQPGLGLTANQNTYIFDNTLFVVDQNVSEDYEPANPAATSPELLTVNLAPAESEPKRCDSGSGGAGCPPSSQQ